tara:strand:+ start:122 stop:304 length:183 start_codon:yes stop_codon:yes gene_type:complete
MRGVLDKSTLHGASEGSWRWFRTQHRAEEFCNEKTGQVDLCSALKDLQKPKNATTILILS